MLNFMNDYCVSAHEKILSRLMEISKQSFVGYGEDELCKSAKEKIKKAIGDENAEVYLLVGGTQTNMTVIDTLLRSYEGVVSADTGHIGTHEAGAIENSGNKVLTLPEHNGKIDANELSAYIEKFYKDENHEHMVFPGMVYISHPTELGTLYSKAEFEAISSICRKYEIPLFLDGARLGYGLAAKETDVTIKDIAKYCDVFYIGGTKVGALFGEAVVFTRNAPKHFVNSMKQHGALLAKGFLLGLQFDTLFTDDLYFEISKNAIETADKLKKAFKEKGYSFLIDSPTNQIFVILENEKRKELEKNAIFGFWDTYDENHTVVRIATSWATKMEDVDALIKLL